ncbi:MAG: leucyl aminopeptidase [Pseudomonadota bacterium]
MQVSFSKAALPKSGAIIVPVFDGNLKNPAFTELNKATKGALERAAKAADFSGKEGQLAVIAGPAGIDNNYVVLIGGGKPAAVSAHTAERMGGAAVAKIIELREKAALFFMSGVSAKEMDDDALAAHMAFGARLRSYRFDKYRTTQEKSEKLALTKIGFYQAASGAKAAYGDLDALVNGIFLTRDLVSEPANILYPESFADRCRALEELGVKVKVLGEKEMEKLGMGSLLGVGQGSVRESKIVAMEWMGGTKGDAPVCFVGKGVTFDTGGISIKPAGGMEDMKWDMGGAGAVTGAMAAIAGRKAKANVVGVIGLVENMPDGNAQRPGDVVTSMSGKTIEVLNTDAEGRLVLADAIWWTQETYKPKTVIDLATLTGAILVSLAHEFAGLFVNDETLAEELLAIGDASGDKLWHMPLTKTHYDMIKSPIADIKNLGGRWGGSSTAASFIGSFIKDGVRWAHLDIAGMAWNEKDTPTIPKGGAGYGVRLLDTYIRTHAE